ncbi:hypothetical protein E2C01_067780 [Portunus trituberculatus]|uniref:Uncharacterized protein n=1 Tax=Portunus trituberculatus TaxID=210409 RepID=A0A5B7HKQ7_PORTR|nr:hypothetical protein [Portunus trituberculatus]
MRRSRSGGPRSNRGARPRGHPDPRLTLDSGWGMSTLRRDAGEYKLQGRNLYFLSEKSEVKKMCKTSNRKHKR